jgi:hypothetical protein
LGRHSTAATRRSGCAWMPMPGMTSEANCHGNCG